VLDPLSVGWVVCLSEAAQYVTSKYTNLVEHKTLWGEHLCGSNTVVISVAMHLL